MTLPLRRILLTFCLLLSSLAVADGEAPEPGREWLAPALAKAEGMERLYSLLVSHRGELVLERYYNGRGPDDIANIKSASKSVISALVGVAIDQGHLEGLDQPIGDFFPERLAGEENAAKRAITIEDLLTMRSGLESTSNRNYARWILSDNWIDYVLEQPLVEEPGTLMQYSTGNTHLLSAILTQATGESTLEWAREALGRPLGFHLSDWPTDPQGIHFGGNDMEMTPRQMLRFGRLYLNEGRHEGRQVLPAQWVEDSLIPRTLSMRHLGRRAYGYGWWISQMGGQRAAFAWGYGGQYIVLVPQLDLLVITTSNPWPGNGRRRHTRLIHELVKEDIVARLAAARVSGAAPP